jgi:protein MpaA
MTAAHAYRTSGLRASRYMRSADPSAAGERRLRMMLDVFFAALALAGGHQTAPAREVIGHSASGRPIRAVSYGRPDAARTVVVFGCIHGNECEGIKITKHVQSEGAAPRAARIVLVHQLNPDGYRLRVRQNGRGVDLNRNFPSQWIPIGTRWHPEYSGPRPWSEPETRVARRLIDRIRPDITIWYHQPQALVRAWGQSRPAARRYAQYARVPYRSIPWPNGTAPNWQNHRFAGTSAFVVELPAGVLSASSVERHARAVLRLAKTG